MESFLKQSLREDCPEDSHLAPDIAEKRERLLTFLQTALKYKRIPAEPVQHRYDDDDDEEEEEEEGEGEEVLGVVDPHCLLSPADIRSVDGRLDEAGLPLGRCLVSLQSGEELSGVWRAGSYSQARERTVICRTSPCMAATYPCAMKTQ